MIPLPLRLRSFLPRFVGEVLLRRWWARFWYREWLENQRTLGLAAPRFEGAERATLIETIWAYFPFSTMLEVGCAYGQNFYIHSKISSSITLVGVDRSLDVVNECMRMAEQQSLKNVRIMLGDGADLSQFSDGSFDIVYTSACLLYCSPPVARAVAREVIRVAKTAAIFLEQHESVPFPPFARFVYRPSDGGYWIHDFAQLLKDCAPEREFKLTQVPNPVWNTEDWARCGVVAEVKLGV